ncbi:hypothetical protein SASPL_138211 [Salvia splendens]|uniref:Uncharacterized protein n=1 Tax=Salvia splendens TaxID=180675 RepID=A0A8X8ZE41_SALSN|nr:hypothetical protein SASPL_138211 [Salvia splendens]
MPSPTKIAPSSCQPDTIQGGLTSLDRMDSSKSSLSSFQHNDSLSGPHHSYLSSCDIIIDVDDTSYDSGTLTEFNVVSELAIRTKPPGKHERVSLEGSGMFRDMSVKSPVDKPRRSRKSFSGRVKIGRKLGGKKPEGRRSRKPEKGIFFTERFAVVKGFIRSRK